MWLGAAAGRPCRNLDPYLSGADEIVAAYRTHGSARTLAWSRATRACTTAWRPTAGQQRSACAHAPLAGGARARHARHDPRCRAPRAGPQAFERDIRIAGVILNRVGGARHASKLRAAIERHTDVPVLGAMHADAALAIERATPRIRPANETADAARIAGRHRGRGRGRGRSRSRCSPSRRRRCRTRAPCPGRACRKPAPAGSHRHRPRRRVRLLLRGRSRRARARRRELLPFDTLRDAQLPEVDALFVGGGFPETQAARSPPMRACAGRSAGASRAAFRPMPNAAASCTSRADRMDGRASPMVGALPADIVVEPQPVGRGYVSSRRRAPLSGAAAAVAQRCARTNSTIRAS